MGGSLGGGGGRGGRENKQAAIFVHLSGACVTIETAACPLVTALSCLSQPDQGLSESESQAESVTVGGWIIRVSDHRGYVLTVWVT